LFSDPAHRRLFADWENAARGALATFRADCAQHIGDPDFESMVARLTRLNPEFAAWWPGQDVAHRLPGKKRLDHPTVGRMHFTFSTLAVGDRPDIKRFVFTAVDEEDTPRKLSQLLARPI
jgi:hypothetical protein